MHDVYELLALLFLMVLGHNAVRGARRLVRETAMGLLVWCVTIAVLVILILYPRVLATSLRVLAAAGVVYVAYGLVVWFFRLLYPVPHQPGPHARHIRELLASAGLPASLCRQAVAQALEAAEGRIAIAAAGVIEAILGRFEGEQLAAEVVRAAVEQRAAADAALEVLQGASVKPCASDQTFVDGLILRYGAKAPQKSWRALRSPPEAANPRKLWFAAMQKERVSPSRAALLHYLNIEVTAETRSQESAWSRLRGVKRVPALLSPTYAYLALREPGRAALFSLCYVLTAAYGVFSLAEGAGARALVFLAVAALLHLSALVNLDVVCAGPVAGRCPPEAAGAADKTVSTSSPT